MPIETAGRIPTIDVPWQHRNIMLHVTLRASVRPIWRAIIESSPRGPVAQMDRAAVS
jgi:hypothetical protein